jgi:hypothetical protein
MKLGYEHSSSAFEFVSGGLTQKPPQPSKPLSHFSQSGLEGSSVDVDGGGED